MTQRTGWPLAAAGLALSALLFGTACTSEEPSTTPTTAIPAASASAPATAATVAAATAAATATSASTASPTVTTATKKVSANTATRAEIQTALTDAGVPNAAQWAKEVVEYRPYPADDSTWAKLRKELAKYNPAPGVVDQIIAVLTP